MTDAAVDDPIDDGIDDLSVAESEIPEVRREARDWLIRNNTSDQKAIAIFALALGTGSILFQLWWTVVLALCIAAVLPFRWMAGPYFRRGDLRQGILWANLGSWYLLFPLVIIIPETLPIAMQNVIGPVILAATYLERRLVRRLIPVTVMIAIAVSVLSMTVDVAHVDDVPPRWLFVTVLCAYIGANLLLVMGDIQELNLVHLRSLQRAVRQNDELRLAEQALRDSRRRILVAADEERVRLERDLHDGAQQQLVSLSLQLRLAAELAEEGATPTPESLMALHQAAADAVDDVRHLAQGLYPTRIRELGLARALHGVARRSPVPITVTDQTSHPIDDATQVALYFVCLEAIQNASKHGSADTSIEVVIGDRVDDGPPELELTIRDDGPGFDPGRHTDARGLLNMADRVGALGGDLRIDSEPGGGTTITARLPSDLDEPAAVSA